MPLTLKLSKRFYEAFGEEAADQLVGWMNQVDAELKGDMKDLVDKSYLDAKLEQLRADLLKWMFIYWTGSVLAIAAFVLLGIRLSQ